MVQSISAFRICILEYLSSHVHDRRITSLLKTHQFYFIILTFLSTSAFAGEGMWLPFLLKSLNETEMKSMGMKMNAEDIYSVNQGSLKDAVVHFGGFCTAEVIS